MITSTSNQQVKSVIALRQKKKERDTRSLFLAEGAKMFLEAPAERIEAVYVSESFAGKHMSMLEERQRKHAFPLEVVADRVLAAMSDTQTPQGVICVLRQFRYEIEDLLGTGNPLLLILENLQDPGNLGTILRSAEGAGVTGILLSGTCVDLYNPKVIRSTMGSVYRIPFCYAENFFGALAKLKQKGLRLYAAHLKGTASYDEESYLGATGFLIGNESQGLTSECASCADTYVKIPMAGKVESLNAGVAASLLAFEAARQRRPLGNGENRT